MKYLTFKRAAVIAAASALFFLLGRFVSISSPIETVNICIQYGLLGFVAVAFGPLTGAMTGLLGHILIDLSAGELCWSWIVASSAFGGLVGALSYITRVSAERLTGEDLIRFNLIQVATHVVCWAGIAPVLEILLYNESMDRIFEQGLTAAISNAVTTAVVGSVLLWAWSLIRKKKRS